MKKMNGKTLQIEPATCGGHDHIDNHSFNAALNLWAKRRGIEWGNSFKKRLRYGKNANRRADDEMA